MTIGRRIGSAVLAAVIAGTLLFGVAGASGSVKVKVKNNKFSPGTAKIQKGGKVVWKFVEGKHNVTGNSFSSGNKRGGKFKVKFKNKGTYSYVCTLHSGMDGKVKVK